MDDASTDDTPRIVQSVDDKRIRYYRNDRTLGQFGNISRGIELAKGDLIAIQHADDVYLPKIIEHELRFLSDHPDLGAVFSLDTFVDADGREWGRAQPPAEFRGDVILEFNAVLNGVLRHGNTFIRGGTSLVWRHVYATVGPFTDRYHLRGDIEMWLRIAERFPIGILDEYLTCYRWGHDHLSGRYEHLRTEPELTFSLLDQRLDAGDRRLAAPDALAGYEGRRAVDLLMVTTNQYILATMPEARKTLGRVRLRHLLGTSRVQRGRMLVLYLVLHGLVRARRSERVAESFRRRWHGGPGQTAPPA